MKKILFLFSICFIFADSLCGQNTDILFSSITTKPWPYNSTLLATRSNTSNDYKETMGICVEFPIGKSTICTDFKNNNDELFKLRSNIAKILINKNIDNISIIGYMPPEGALAFNQSLSKRRAKALKKYILEMFPELTPEMLNISSVETVQEETKDTEKAPKKTFNIYFSFSN